MTPQTLQFTLPWPNRVLNPNVKAHWSEVARANKEATSTGFFLCRDEYGRPLPSNPYAKAKLTITINFPDKRKRDIDNIFASLKPALDGISLALGIDDSNFDFEIKRGEIIKGGSIGIEVQAS